MLQDCLGWEEKKEEGWRGEKKAFGSSVAHLPSMLQAPGFVCIIYPWRFVCIVYPINTFTHAHFAHEKLFCWFRNFPGEVFSLWLALDRQGTSPRGPIFLFFCMPVPSLFSCSQPGLHRQRLHWEKLEGVAAKTHPFPESYWFLLRFPTQSCFKRAISGGSRMPDPHLLHLRWVRSSGDCPVPYFASYLLS